MNILSAVLFFLIGKFSSAENHYECSIFGNAVAIDKVSNLAGEYYSVGTMISKWSSSGNSPAYQIDYSKVDYTKCYEVCQITFDGASTLTIMSRNLTEGKFVFSEPPTGNPRYIIYFNTDPNTTQTVETDMKYLYVDDDWQVLAACGLEPRIYNEDVNTVTFLLKKENAQSAALSFQDVAEKIRSLGFEIKSFQNFCSEPLHHVMPERTQNEITY